MVKSFAFEGSRKEGWRSQLCKEGFPTTLYWVYFLAPKYLLSIYCVPGTSKGRSPVPRTPLDTQALSLLNLTELSHCPPWPPSAPALHRLPRASALLVDAGPPESRRLLLPPQPSSHCRHSGGTGLRTRRATTSHAPPHCRPLP